MYAYRTLRVEIPWRLVEERPDVLDLVTRMRLAAEEYVRRLLKEVTGQEESGLTAEELDRLLTPDRRELAVKIIEEVFPKYDLKKYFVNQGKVFWRDVVFHRAVPLDAQLRIENERDVGRAVFVDLRSEVLKVRRLNETFVVRLRRNDIAWIRERLEEGAKLKLAFLGVERRRGREPTYGKLYIALVFARETAPVEPKAVVAVDVNRLDHGIMVGLLVDGKIVRRMRLLDEGAVRELRRLHEEISRLDERAAREADPARKRRLEDRARHLASKRFRKMRDVVIRIAGEIIKLAREHQAVIVLDTMEDESYRELKEGDGSGVRKHFLDGLGQLRRRLQTLAEWYGLPYLEERLYSTICPRCGAKMEGLSNRRMHCPSCGFSDHRDNVPLIWAKKRYWELLQKQPAFSATILLLTS
ncbi:zinc ribbon domain-containing protein [Pyrobaculum neutrophilum]|uniref:Transposase IS605 OrfB n=1 Tax=Pyrobaculum neutrophilum (strain DSM 2338 / JCM 9278 / NBRC 100436 / V24Sta) TaxID=444157 RepID=B1YCL3_PYRNV|nr:zinc ribbon domain-containing protein [Pyrobaculum neutrophilum]ACB39526.1 transposase IS605 OrfB [Pyrobaculum neutrophilum V24Sta]